MKPLHFKEATIELKKPESMTDEDCKSLWVHRSEDGTCISLWSVSFWKRLKFLFHGKLWLGVYSGGSQPLLWLDMDYTVFIRIKKLNKSINFRILALINPKERRLCYRDKNYTMKVYTDIELQDLLKRSRTSVEICEYLDYLEEFRDEINPSIHILMSTLANGKLNRALESESKVIK